jgi:hypothetical protein
MQEIHYAFMPGLKVEDDSESGRLVSKVGRILF